MPANRIVVGLGGAGGEAVNSLLCSDLEGLDFLIANTDVQALETALTDHVIQLGPKIARGLGANAKLDIGKAATEESLSDLMRAIAPYKEVIFVAGLGGGTGTGAIKIAALEASKSHKVACVVTTPFKFEGASRAEMAEKCITELREAKVPVIVINMQELFQVSDEKTTFADAFRLVQGGIREIVAQADFEELLNRSTQPISLDKVKPIEHVPGKWQTARTDSLGKVWEQNLSGDSQQPILNPEGDPGFFDDWDWEAIYLWTGLALAALTAVGTFFGSWIYCIDKYGYLLGVGLGWLPSLITAAVAAGIMFFIGPLLLLAILPSVLLAILGILVTWLAPEINYWRDLYSPMANVGNWVELEEVGGTLSGQSIRGWAIIFATWGLWKMADHLTDHLIVGISEIKSDLKKKQFKLKNYSALHGLCIGGGIVFGGGIFIWVMSFAIPDFFSSAPHHSNPSSNSTHEVTAPPSLANAPSASPQPPPKGNLIKLPDEAIKEIEAKIGRKLDLSNRDDAIVAIAVYGEINRELLKAGGYADPTDADLFAAHHLGAEGFLALKRRATEQIPAAPLVTPEVFNNNRFVFFDDVGRYRTPAQVIQKLHQIYLAGD